MDYDIIKATSTEKLTGFIKQKLSEGWKLQGGVSSLNTGLGIFFFQAICKD